MNKLLASVLILAAWAAALLFPVEFLYLPQTLRILISAGLTAIVFALMLTEGE